jgi:hypothetical protein
VQSDAVANVLAAAGLPVAFAGDLLQSHRDDERRMPAGVFAVSGSDAADLIAPG